MSARLGPRTLGHNHAMPFLGREFSQEPDYSDEVAQEIDAEIRRIIEDAHDRAKSVLEEHRDQLEEVSRILIERETLERIEFEALLEGKPEDEVFRDRDEREAKRKADRDAATKKRAPARPKAAQPAHVAPVNPVNPGTT
jgi:cell division protease FtsH